MKFRPSYHPLKKEMKGKLMLISKPRKESKRKEDQDFPKIWKTLLKDSKQILKDGYQNGKEKVTKRKEEKVQERLKA